MLNMNSARSFVGKSVNVHLRDGSVILNVRVVSAERQTIKCKVKGQRKLLKVLLKDIAWLEQLNPYFVKRD